MKNKSLIKYFILSIMICLSLFITMPQVFRSNTCKANTESIIHINVDNAEYIYNQPTELQVRHVSASKSSDIIDINSLTTGIGVVLLSIIFLIAIKTLPLEKRL